MQPTMREQGRLHIDASEVASMLANWRHDEGIHLSTMLWEGPTAAVTGWINRRSITS